jgi:hypothetical protein
VTLTDTTPQQATAHIARWPLTPPPSMHALLASGRPLPCLGRLPLAIWRSSPSRLDPPRLALPLRSPPALDQPVPPSSAMLARHWPPAVVLPQCPCTDAVLIGRVVHPEPCAYKRNSKPPVRALTARLSASISHRRASHISSSAARRRPPLSPIASPRAQAQEHHLTS